MESCSIEAIKWATGKISKCKMSLTKKDKRQLNIFTQFLSKNITLGKGKRSFLLLQQPTNLLLDSDPEQLRS